MVVFQVTASTRANYYIGNLICLGCATFVPMLPRPSKSDYDPLIERSNNGRNRKAYILAILLVLVATLLLLALYFGVINLTSNGSFWNGMFGHK